MSILKNITNKITWQLNCSGICHLIPNSIFLCFFFSRKKCMRSLGYAYSLSDPLHNKTLYNDEYVWKPYSKETSLRPVFSKGAIYYNIRPSKVSYICIYAELNTISIAHKSKKYISQKLFNFYSPGSLLDYLLIIIVFISNYFPIL